MTKAKTKILIVEDEIVIAEDLKDILEIGGHCVVGIAQSYNTAIALLAEKDIDLCFLDIALRGNGSGIDVAEVINRRYKIPFIFITSFSDQDTVAEVIAQNPSAYLVKPYKEKDIAPLVALALANFKKLTKELFPSQEILNTKISTALSLQEYKILKLLWQGNKNQEIGDQLFISINTVKTHIAKIYRKMGVKTRATAIKKVIAISDL